MATVALYADDSPNSYNELAWVMDINVNWVSLQKTSEQMISISSTHFTKPKIKSPKHTM